MKRIEGESIVLRDLMPSDAAGYAALCADPALRRVLTDGDGVEVDDGIKAVVLVFQQLKIAQRADIIAQGQVAGGLYAGKNTFFGVHERSPR